MAREVVRRVQDMRKQADFRVDDRIDVKYAASARLAAAIHDHAAMLAEDVLAESIQAVQAPRGERLETFSFDGETLQVAIQRRAATRPAAGRG
jgi:isoleucyl-tRNA synthetase